MENRLSRPRALAMLACALVMLVCTLAIPEQVYAELAPWNTCYVQDSSGNKTHYHDQQEAINAACEQGKIVVITFSEPYDKVDAALVIPAGKTVTINMNGQTLRNYYGTLFELKENSSLILQSYSTETGSDPSGERFSAGVISNSTGHHGGAIAMDEGSHLTLDNVLIKENEGQKDKQTRHARLRRRHLRREEQHHRPQ